MKHLFRAFFFLVISLPSSAQDLLITALRPTNDCPNGELDLMIRGGVGPYDIAWEWAPQGSPQFFPLPIVGNAVGNDGREDLDGLTPSTYRVTVTDAVCGTQTLTIELLQGLIFGDSDRIIANVDHVNTCGDEGTNDGRIEITEILGIPRSEWNISWSGTGIIPGTIGTTIDGLRDGSYTATVRTSDGCVLTRTFQICCCEQQIGDGKPKNLDKNDRCVSTTLNFPVSVIREELYSPDDALSYNGEIRIRVDGGNENNVITWSGPDGFYSDRVHIFGLGVGEYCVTVDNGCSDAERCFELVDCSLSPLQLRVFVDNSCRSLGGLDINAGAISVIPEGGRPPFTYRWSNGSTSPNITRLSAGVYCVTVSDDRGCRPETTCIGIDYNPLVPGAASGSRCGEAWYCNGIEYELDFQPYNTYWAYDDQDCRVQHEYCTYDNPDRRMPTPPRVNDYLDVLWHPDRCQLIGICPDGSGIQTAANGDIVDNFFVSAVPCQECDSGIKLVCRNRIVCSVEFNGMQFERHIRFEIREDMDIGTAPAPLLCNSGCSYTCDGNPSVEPVAGSTNPQCAPICDAGVLGGANYQTNAMAFQEENYSIADLIQGDLNNMVDISKKVYYFPGKVQLSTRLNNIGEWTGESPAQTVFQNLSYDSIQPYLTGYVPNYGAEESTGIFANDVDIRVHPNPVVNDILYITSYDDHLSSNLDLSVSIINWNGQLVAERILGRIGTQLSINTKELPPGVYLLKFFGPFKGSINKKVIVK